MSENWIDRVKQTAKERNLKDREIAEQVGCAQGTYSLWMNGKRKCKLEYRLAIADVLGVSLRWLETGEDPLDPKKILNFSLDEAADFFGNDIQAVGRATRYSADSNSDASMFEAPEKLQIRMENDSMTDLRGNAKTSIPAGSKVTIDLKKTPAPGDIILVEYSGEMLLRVWQRLNHKHHILTVINPSYMDDLKVVYKDDLMKIFKGTAISYEVSLTTNTSQ